MLACICCFCFDFSLFLSSFCWASCFRRFYLKHLRKGKRYVPRKRTFGWWHFGHWVWSISIGITRVIYWTLSICLFSMCSFNNFRNCLHKSYYYYICSWPSWCSFSIEYSLLKKFLIFGDVNGGVLSVLTLSVNPYAKTFSKTVIKLLL